MKKAAAKTSEKKPAAKKAAPPKELPHALGAVPPQQDASKARVR